MRINLDDKNYIDVQKNRGNSVRMSIKAKKDDKTSVLVSARLSEDDITSLISALVEAKAKMT